MDNYTNHIMNRKIALFACVSAAIAVILGAFGAHGLKTLVAPSDIENWKTGVSYQFYHTFALLFLSTLRLKGNLVKTSAILFALGILAFPGSLYLLSTRSVTGLNASFLGPVTPIGGLLFILGWVTLALAVIRNK